MARIASLKARIAADPFAFWFVLGIGLLVTAQILWPSLVQETPSSAALPDTLETLFRWSYAIGGWLATAGFLLGRPNYEGAGFSLLASGLATQFSALVYLVTIGLLPSDAAVGSIFIAALAIGSAHRAYNIAKGHGR